MTQRPPQPGWFRWSSLLLALGGVLIFVVAFSGLRAGAALLAGSSPLSQRTLGPTAAPADTASRLTAHVPGVHHGAGGARRVHRGGECGLARAQRRLGRHRQTQPVSER